MFTLLVVDDSETNVDILLELLGDEYDLLVATSGEDALEILEDEKVDMILLDIFMPQMDGFEVCKRVKSNDKTKDIPIIFITASSDDENIKRAYEIGGVDYITKPFRGIEVLSRVKNHLLIHNQKIFLQKEVDKKTKELQELNSELFETQKEIIYTLSEIGELRSKETGNHVKRVALYSELLAKEYGLSQSDVELIKAVAPMHDIGKIAIPDSILNKPGKLTKEEFEEMKKHSEYGYEMLKYSKRPLLQKAAIVAHQHHEKWDGSGYPQGLKENEIDIFGRIVALADVFDALSSDRVYKKAWEDERVFEFIKDQRGKHFEPDLVDIFFKRVDEFIKIRNSLKDRI